MAPLASIVTLFLLLGNRVARVAAQTDYTVVEKQIHIVYVCPCDYGQNQTQEQSGDYNPNLGGNNGSDQQGGHGHQTHDHTFSTPLAVTETKSAALWTSSNTLPPHTSTNAKSSRPKATTSLTSSSSKITSVVSSSARTGPPSNPSMSNNSAHPTSRSSASIANTSRVTASSTFWSNSTSSVSSTSPSKNAASSSLQNGQSPPQSGGTSTYGSTSSSSFPSNNSIATRSSPTTTGTSSSQSLTSASTSSVPTLTGVSTNVVTNPTSCYQLPTPTANLLEVSDSDTLNTTLGTALDLFLDPVTSNVVYLGIQVDGGEYLYDFSNYPNSLAIIIPSGNALIIDDNGFHAFAADCSIEADILVPNMFEQLEAEDGNSKKRSLNALKKRSQTDFQVDLQLSDQCGNLVTTQIFPDNALALGRSQCSLLPSPQTNPSIGVWSWGCQYPGLQSAEGQCETAVTTFLTGFFGAISTVGYALTAAATFLLYGPVVGAIEFTELIPILRTGVEGVNIVFKPVQAIGTAVKIIGADKVAGAVCSIKAAPPYDLVFSPSSGPAIDLTPLESAPVFVLRYSETIQNDAEPPNCTLPVVCQPSTAQLDEAWDLPCNVLPNPGLDMEGLDVFGYPIAPTDIWGEAGDPSQWIFGYGGTDGTGLPGGSNGCASGTANDTCM